VKLPAIAAWAITFIFVNLAWVLFRAPDIATAASFFKSMLGGRGFHGFEHVPQPYILATLGAACVLALLPRNSMQIARDTALRWPMQTATALLLAAGILSLGNPTEFLYFNF
jgi:hypothetical protein